MAQNDFTEDKATLFGAGMGTLVISLSASSSTADDVLVKQH